MITMKALSVKQPWAWLIANGHKDIENRTWNTHFRGKFLVHASKGLDKKALDKYLHLIPSGTVLKRGGIVGAVMLDSVVKESTSEWFIGPFGFVLKDAKPCMFVECKGKLGFFEVKI